MQDRYVGEVGDFGKYGLLRALGEGLRLGVVWYLTPDESHNANGRHVGYLEPTPANLGRFRDCDPGLYDALAGIIGDGDRSVRAIRKRGVLPPGTAFFEEPLSFEELPARGPQAIAARLDRRERWVQGALGATSGCDLLFADPDNGIECGRRRHEKLGPKHVYLDELAPYARRGQSVVVYHHLDRSAAARVQIARALDRLACALQPAKPPFALHYRRGTARAFLVVPTAEHHALLSDRARGFALGPWGQHVTLLEHGLPAQPLAG